MSAAEISLFLFPTGLGEDDVVTRGEAPVLLTAFADTTLKLFNAVDGVEATQPSCLELLQPEQRARHVSIETEPITSLKNNNSLLVSSQSNKTAVNGGVFFLASSANNTTVSTNTGVAPAELMCRMHYMAANYLHEMQHGISLGRSLPLCTSLPRRLLAPAGGYVKLKGGRRCYYVCPVEEGRYISAVCLPFHVWYGLGGGGDGAVCAQFLLHTALTSTALPLSAIRKKANNGENQRVCYTSLHKRLTTDPHLIQQNMAARVKTVAHVSMHATAHPQRYASRVAALRRLFNEDVSPLRTHPQLGQRVETLLRTATSSTSPASLRGVTSVMGLAGSEHRYALGASSVWYRGHPLYTSLTAAEQHQQQQAVPSHFSKGVQLRSAALSVMLEELEKLIDDNEIDVSFRASYNTPVTVTSQCFCVAPPNARQTSPGYEAANGYISQTAWASPTGTTASTAADSTTDQPPCAVTMAFTSSCGWTIALLLQPMRTPFVGSPLSTIFHGVQSLMTDELESDAFFTLVQSATAAMRGSTWRRPVHLVSPLAAQLEGAVTTIQVGRRLPGCAASQDRVLYSLDLKAAATRTTTTFPSASKASALLSSLTFRSHTPALRSISLLKDLCLNREPDRVDKKRKAALIASFADVQQRRCLSDADNYTRCSSSAHLVGGYGCSSRLSPVTDTVVQTAMRYVHLTARLQKNSVLSRCGPRAAVSSRRSQEVFSVVHENDVVRLIKAIPHCCNSAAAANRAAYAVTYVVVELEKKRLPLSAEEEFRAFTSWVLARCL